MNYGLEPSRAQVPRRTEGQVGQGAHLPVNSIKELIDYSQRNSGKVHFGSAGIASFQHFAIELFKPRTGADLTVVQYKGGVPALLDLAAGHVQVSLGNLIQMQTFLRSGKIKLLGVAGSRRVNLIADDRR